MLMQCARQAWLKLLLLRLLLICPAALIRMCRAFEYAIWIRWQSFYVVFVVRATNQLSGEGTREAKRLRDVYQTRFAFPEWSISAE